MSDTPMHLIVDLETKKTQYVPFTAEEIQQRELDAIEAATRKAEADAEAARIEAVKVSARKKLTTKEPLTEEEAATIVL